MKIILAAVSLLALCLSSCESTGGLSDGIFVAYTDGVEVSNSNVEVVAGQESTTATGAGYNLKSHQAYVAYADGHRSQLKISGAGFGGGNMALVLSDGSRVNVNLKTGKVTTVASPFANPLPQ